MNSRRITAYLSHSIRGSKGINATEEETRANCREAFELAKFIREHIPEIDLYVPAEYEEFVYRAYTCGYMTEQQVLDIDCQILESKDLHIVYVKDGWVGGGIEVEVNHANEKNIPIVYICNTDLFDAKIMKLIGAIKKIYESRSDTQSS